MDECQTVKEEPDLRYGTSEDDDEDTDIPRCGISLEQFKTRIKEEMVEGLVQDCESFTKDKSQEEEEEEGDEKEAENDLEDELEYKVAHFLAETSVSRRRQKKSGKSSIKSACKFKCNQCSALFRYKSTLTYHMKSECGTGVIMAGSKVVRNSPALCNICNKQLSSRTSLMVHLRIHTGERPFGCAECGQSFSQNAHLKDHVSRLHSQGPHHVFLCRICNKTFTERASLRLHMDEHVGQQRPFQCDICKRRYQTQERLSCHSCLTENKPNRRRGLLCSACGFIGSSRSSLRDHLATHPLPVTCPRCNNSFESLPAWRKHNRRYHRSRQSKCSYCSRTFPSEYDVRVHERTHTGERPYTCTFCGRSFARKSILDVHTTLHTGRCDYVCSDCGMAFNRKSKLDVHKAEHTDIHVECEMCGKTFKCKAYLMTHLKTHDRGFLTCSRCSKVFTTRRTLRTHLNRGNCAPPVQQVPADLSAEANQT